MLWQAAWAAPRGLQISSVYLPLHPFSQRGTVQSLATHRWLAGGLSKWLLFVPAAAEPPNILIKRHSRAKLTTLHWGPRDSRGKEEDTRQKLGHRSLTKEAGEECLRKPRNGSVTGDITEKTEFNRVSEHHSIHPSV